MNWFAACLGYTAGAVLAVLPIVNPLGAVPLVLSVAAHLPEPERQRQIRRACIYTFALMAGFLLAGSLVMNFFGISMPGMRIAGGMIVAVSSWLALRAAERFNRLLGVTRMIALTRLMGLLMICIGVQFIINGLMVIVADPTVWAGLAEALRR